MGEIAVKVENLGKCYQIGQAKSGDFRESFSGWIDKLRGGSNGKVAESKEFWALKDINFEIEKGEAVGIIGRNGAGKSTLLKILSRITEPTTGRFEINGRVSSLLEVGTGFHPELSGRENIYLNGTILGMKRKEIKAKFDEIVAFSGVEKFIDTPVKHYSSGMKVRLAFSVAAHLEPEILIIDEVLAVGDAEFQKKCLGKMDEVSRNEGRTVIFVSHNMDAVEVLCSNAILLNDGQIEDFNRTSFIIEKYQSCYTEIKFPLMLTKTITLDSLILKRYEVSQFDDLEIYLQFNRTADEVINECSILIYNYLNQRMGIVDLREFNIQNFSKSKSLLQINLTLKELPLMSGTYRIGLFLSTVSVRQNFYDLARFTVKSKNLSFIPYKERDRGLLSFNTHALLD